MRAHVTYLVIRGVSAFAFTTSFTLSLVYQVQAAGLGPLELVLVGTTLELVCFTAQVPTGVLADLYSRKWSVIIGYVLLGFGMTLEGLVPSFGVILAASAVMGVGFTFVDGAQEAWAVDELGQERAPAVLVRGGQVGQAATVAGIGVSVALGSLSLFLPLVVAGVILLLFGPVLAVLMREHGFRPVPPDERGSWASMRRQAATAVRTSRADPALLCLLAALLGAALASEGIDRLSPAHFLTGPGFPAAATPVIWFGALSAAAMAGAIACTELVRRTVDLADAVRVARTLAALQAACAGAALVFALAGDFWLAAFASVCVGMTRQAAHPLIAAWLSQRTEPATRATVYSLIGQVDATGQLAGGPPIGLLAERVSIRAALVLVACLLTAPVVFLIAMARRSRKLWDSNFGPYEDDRLTH
ncbi:tetracycline efflux MFS transporter TetA(P) [Acrocarpospora phusangensis]|uniref:Tetracycline efflux MFS transporter TetA(P) n=1 Tax=Acrocarpospora phusangensis TaxID=1070424 RepID=A0A919QEW1_9ACTN|nr:MFS transporter [Acrocarpospora phusangensis]GIH24987.1 tetracycline efflux MFS transporter TetA(P) [Acrocarpospora phusangensis]